MQPRLRYYYAINTFSDAALKITRVTSIAFRATGPGLLEPRDTPELEDAARTYLVPADRQMSLTRMIILEVTAQQYAQMSKQLDVPATCLDAEGKFRLLPLQ
jgi:hypothetical protein